MMGEVAEDWCVPAINKLGTGASPIAKQPNTKNIKLPRATTRSLMAGCIPSREPRREYRSGRTAISITNVAIALKGEMKLDYFIN